MPSLFSPIRLGSIEAPNRILMAPLTRSRNTRDHVATPLMIDYYRQRAGAGLIVSEATGISLQSVGWPYAGGIWTEEQTEAWKPIVAAVHEAGGRIVSQLWHMGRAVHPSMPGRLQPISASATTQPGLDHTYDGKQPFVEARALKMYEVPALLDDYRNATRNALAAGFDGVQVHAANGYLIDQFLRDSTNLRTDRYGGPIENRIRMLVEITQAVIGVAGAGRTSVRLSPNGDRRGVNDSNPEPLFEAAAKALSGLGIGFLDVREPAEDGTFGLPERPPIAPLMRRAFKGTFVLNSDFTFERAQAALAAGEADAIAFGRSFIANPDLPYRFANGIPLRSSEMETWYTQGINGYSDYDPAEVA